jgi:hypothetical protein
MDDYEGYCSNYAVEITPTGYPSNDVSKRYLYYEYGNGWGCGDLGHTDVGGGYGDYYPGKGNGTGSCYSQILKYRWR